MKTTRSSRPTFQPALTSWREPHARYRVIELPWLRGSGRRVIGKFRYFHEACRHAERLSHEQRQLMIECAGQEVALYLGGRLMPRAA